MCVADGEGRNSVWRAEQGHDVSAWDASRVAVEKAQRLAAQHGVSVAFTVDDAQSYDWSARQFDVVVAVFIQFAEPDLRDAIFRGMKAATRPGGLIFLNRYTPEQLAFGTGGASFEENLYTTGQLRSCVEDFGIHRLTACEAEIEEGVEHSGRSALIDLIARQRD